MLRYALIFVLSLAAPSASAEEVLLGTYRTLISSTDMVSSKGVPLTDPAAMIQQDRANYHRYNLRDAVDADDGWFADPAKRAKIPQLIANGGGVPEYVADVMINFGAVLSVSIYASEGRLSSIRMEITG